MAFPWRQSPYTAPTSAPAPASTLLDTGVRSGFGNQDYQSSTWQAPKLVNGQFASDADRQAFIKALNAYADYQKTAPWNQPTNQDAMATASAAGKWGQEHGFYTPPPGGSGGFFSDTPSFLGNSALTLATLPPVLAAAGGIGLSAAGVGGTSAGGLPTTLGGSSALTADQQLAQSVAGLSATGPSDTAAALGVGEVTPLAAGAVGESAAPSASAASGLGGASGTVGQLFADTATGVGASGLAGEATSTAAPALASSGGLPASVVGSSTQFPAGLGPPGVDPAEAFNAQWNPSAMNDALTGNTGTSTVGSTLGKIASGAGNYLMKNPGLALAAAGLATQLLRKPGIPQEGNLNTQYNTQEAQGQADVAAARAGTISPSQQAQIDKFTKDSDAALKQYFANSGQGVDSTSYLQAKQNLDQTALAMRQGYVDQLFSQGLQELGLADSAQAQLVQLRLQREQQTSDAMNSFMMTLGLMGAFSGSRANA